MTCISPGGLSAPRLGGREMVRPPNQINTDSPDMALLILAGKTPTRCYESTCTHWSRHLPNHDVEVWYCRCCAGLQGVLLEASDFNCDGTVIDHRDHEKAD